LGRRASAGRELVKAGSRGEACGRSLSQGRWDDRKVGNLGKHDGTNILETQDGILLGGVIITILKNDGLRQWEG